MTIKVEEGDGCPTTWSNRPFLVCFPPPSPDFRGFLLVFEAEAAQRSFPLCSLVPASPGFLTVRRCPPTFSSGPSSSLPRSSFLPLLPVPPVSSFSDLLAAQHRFCEGGALVRAGRVGRLALSFLSSRFSRLSRSRSACPPHFLPSFPALTDFLLPARPAVLLCSAPSCTPNMRSSFLIVAVFFALSAVVTAAPAPQGAPSLSPAPLRTRLTCRPHSPPPSPPHRIDTRSR